MKKYGIEETAEVCANCTHFIQHYGLFQYGEIEMMERIYAGHCVYPRVKNREPCNKACEHFNPNFQVDPERNRIRIPKAG